ncbi:MAG: hypothetical protein EZS28_008667 [Streblomastix strix]|uniref:Uncharacterized protein n=1 Tax=Streblomastix strix TaxID=222440 RepID=A0A5J4WN50_9EUKA|nr:MAG: hypothetical protein EZS28_008667 [Streblomastix strix]
MMEGIYAGTHQMKIETFNKLLLIFALTALSFGAQYKIHNVKDFTQIPIHDPEVISWPKSFRSWDSNGLLKDNFRCTLDFSSGYTTLGKKKPVVDIEETATEFQSIADDQIGKTKGSKNIMNSDYSAIHDKCYAYPNIYDSLDRIGLISNFIYGDQDFYPSSEYAIAKGPKKAYDYRDPQKSFPSISGTYGNVDGEIYRYERDLNINCHRGNFEDYIDDSIYNYGVVSDECYPNDFKDFPGFDKERYPDEDKQTYHYANGSSPIIKDTCTGTGSFNQYFKGYQFGTLSGGNLTTFKRAFIRYGPVSVNYNFLKPNPDYTDEPHPGYDIVGTTYAGFVIGWNSTDIITVSRSLTFEKKPDSEEYDLLKPISYNWIKGKAPLTYTTQEVVSGELKDVTYDQLYFNSIIVFGSGVSVVRAALGLIAAVLVLPALLL